MRLAKPLALVAVLVAFAALALFFPVRDWILTGLAWVDTHRTVAWLVYVAGYVVATILLVPGSIVTLAAGFIFGLPLGFVVVSVGSVTGATCAFLIGRFFLREWVSHRIEALPRFRALDRATAQDGFTIVLLARLSPLFPFNVLNYGLGLTAVPLRQYFFASWLGMVPGTILYVYVGTLAADLTALVAGDVETGLAGQLLFGVGFIATLLLTLLITRKATNVLRSELEAAEAQPPEESGR